MYVCMHTIYAYKIHVLVQLGGCRPLPESETSKSFLYVDERLFHLEQNHCQEGKHTIGHVS